MNRRLNPPKTNSGRFITIDVRLLFSAFVGVVVLLLVWWLLHSPPNMILRV